MALYNRIRTVLEVASNSDYYKPEVKQEFSFTGTQSYRIVESFSAATTGTVLDLSPHTSVAPLIIVNNGTTNFVYVDFFASHGSQAAGDYAFADANPDTITDNLAGGTFVTGGCAAGDYVVVANSENSGENNGTFLVQVAAANVLTLAAGEALAVNTNDTAATLTFVRKNRLRLNAGNHCVIPRLVLIGGDITVTANSAATDVEIWAVAT